MRDRSSRSRAYATMAGGLAALVLLSACSGSDESAGPSAPPEPVPVEPAVAPAEPATSSTEPAAAPAEPPAATPTEPVAPPAEAAQDGWILELLRRVGPGATEVAAVDHEAVREANGLDLPGDDQDSVLRYLGAMSSGEGPAFDFTLLPIRSIADVDAWEDEIGFSILDVDRELLVGQPPDDVLVVAGRLDGGTVRNRLAASRDAAAAEHAGTPYVAVGEDGRTDLEGRTAVRPLGESLRVTAEDGVAVLAPSDVAIAASIDATGGGPSAADEPALAEALRALKGEAVHGVYATTDVAAFAQAALLDRDGQPVSGPAVGPYVALGTGGGVEGDQPIAVLAFVHADEAAAAANVERLRAVLAEGTSLVAEQPWSALAVEQSIEVRGRVLVARLAAESPLLWARVFQARDTLVAWAP